jgi:hypothetical protein
VAAALENALNYVACATTMAFMSVGDCSIRLLSYAIL